ncbi:MAG TPA: PDZ domain-containing protein [Thermoanaerobaculia bacterium]|nr:PDZ domain-containing protein [Thermoanaerobaculia bacterium]
MDPRKSLFRKTIAILALTVLVAGGLAAQETKCKESAHECEKKIREILSGRRFLGVTFNPGNLVIKAIIPESPAEKAGLRPGDVVMGLNGHDLVGRDGTVFKTFLHESKDGQRVAILIRRDGTYKNLSTQLTAMSEKQIERVVAGHLKEAHTESASAPH